MLSCCAQLLPGFGTIRRRLRLVVAAQLCVMVVAVTLAAHASASAQATANDTCFRPTEGSVVSNPPELRSQNGVLEVTLKFRYRQTVMGEGPVRYCYVTAAGDTAPTLRVHPGDRLVIHFVNQAPVNKYSSAPSTTIRPKRDCSDANTGFYSTNLHFHGMSIPPACHQDDVLHTFVQPGQEFDYDVRIPANQPPGLYWYHPHVHGITESQIQGGASGALIVEGIEKQYPFLADMPQRVLVIRDQQTTPSLDHTAPSWDLSINYVPILYPSLLPAMVQTNPHEKEFWRVVNSAADTILDLQLLNNGQAQKLQLVALDGVAVAPHDRSGRRHSAAARLPSGVCCANAWPRRPDGTNHPRLGYRSRGRSRSPSPSGANCQQTGHRCRAASACCQCFASAQLWRNSLARISPGTQAVFFRVVTQSQRSRYLHLLLHH